MLKKTAVVISLLLVLTILAAIIYSATKPKPFDWNPSFSNYSKQPYGTYVFYEQLKNFFPNKQVRRIQDNDFDWYYYDELFDTDSIDEDGVYYDIIDSTAFLTYLDEESPKFNFIGLNYSFYIDNLNAKALLLHLYQGNNALIASEDISYFLLKMLGVEMDYIDLDMENEVESQKRYIISYNGLEPIEFSKYETLSRIISFPDSARVIATNAHDDVLGITMPIGNGSITLFTAPILFTNYYLLKNSNGMVEEMVTD